MRRSEERFRLLVENAPEYAIFMLDPNGRVSTWNGGAQRIKGSTAEEIIGKHFSIFYPQDAKEGGWTDHELQVATEEGRFVDTGWRVRKDGTTFWAHVIITALRDARAAHAVQRNLGWTQVLLRGESPKGPEAGLGLGLALCKQLVEQHGGSIRAASQGEDKGATFSVVLPVSIAQLQEEGTPRIRSRRRLASSSLRKSGRHAPPTIREGKPSPFLAVPTGTSMSTISNRVLRSLRERAPGAGLTRDFYTDAEIFALDLEEIFYQDWLFVAHSTELPDAGSYLTLQVGEYPIVLTRTADGVVRAFINSCRHRGARVCPEAAGKAAKLVCPYHQWTYNLDGRLFAARQMGPGFDRSQLGLKPVCCETVAGYIFVCLAAEAPDFGPTRRQLEPYLLPHRLSEARVAFRSTLIEEGNWKLVWENNRECYHCAANHPELARTFSDRPTVTSVSGAEDDPLIAEHWRRCESAALASQFQLSPDGQMRTARMPLVGPAVSYTLTGHAAVKRPLSDSIPSNLNIGALLLFHYPTTWNHGLADHAVSFRVLPLGPTRTELTTKWLVHRNAVEGVDYDLNELTQVWLATNEQDRRIVREIQIGMSCPAYEPGPLSNVTEGGVKQFIDWYCTRLEQRLSPDALRKVC